MTSRLAAASLCFCSLQETAPSTTGISTDCALEELFISLIIITLFKIAALTALLPLAPRLVTNLTPVGVQSSDQRLEIALDLGRFVPDQPPTLHL